MTPEDLAQDPAVRAAVFASVTRDEAAAILRSRAGKPWCDAFLLRVVGGWYAPAEVREELLVGVRTVLGVPPVVSPIDWSMCGECPRCEAEKGKPCRDLRPGRGGRVRPHQGRVVHRRGASFAPRRAAT